MSIPTFYICLAISLKEFFKNTKCDVVYTTCTYIILCVCKCIYMGMNRIIDCSGYKGPLRSLSPTVKPALHINIYIFASIYACKKLRKKN